MTRTNLYFTLLCLLAIASSQEIVPRFGVAKTEYTAIGTLDLTCTGDASTATISNIASTLYSGSGTPVGTYNGTFIANDASFTRTIGILQTTPRAGSITNFLASALRLPGSRVFDRIQFLTRYNATGAVITTETCPGGPYNVNFTAIYGFYRSGTPDTADVVVGATQKATVRAIGTLNVVCGSSVDNSSISGIQSTLFQRDTDTAFGTYNGTFFSNDGSFTRVASTIQSFNATGTTSLPYFLANAVNTNGSGRLNNVAYITRYDTVGGVVPAGTCTGSNAGTTTNVPFEASYDFYQPPLAASSTNAASSIVLCGSMIAVIAMLLF